MGLSIVRKFSFSYSSLISDFVDRVLLDGGIVDTTAYLNNTESTATVIMNPSAYKDGILYSFKPNDGTGDFTFTRGSAGTRVSKLGFLENVQTISSELITNGDFSNGTTGWFFGSEWALVNETAVLTGSGTANSLGQTMTIVQGKTYKVEFDVLAMSVGAGKVQMQQGLTNEFSGVGHKELYIDIVNTPFSAVSFARKNSAINMTIDNVSIKEVTRATDLPRITHENFQYDGGGTLIPDSGIPALLMEDESTNLFLQSNDFVQSNWIHNSTLVMTGGYASPDGTLNAYNLAKVGGGSRIGQSVSLTSGLTYTFSFYMKNNGGAASLTATFGVQSVGQAYTITNDWVRYDFTFTATSTATSEMRMFSAVSDIDLLVFGAQLEQGTLSSYIPTTTATRTRLEDSCINGGNSTLINSSEGILYLNIAPFGADNSKRAISLNGGNDSDRLIIRYTTNNQIQVIFRAGSVNVVNQVMTLSNPLDFNQIAVSYKLNEFIIVVNGVQIGSTITSGAVFGTTVNSLDFEEYNGLDKFRGKVLDGEYYDKAAETIAQLQTLTTQ